MMDEVEQDRTEDTLVGVERTLAELRSSFAAISAEIASLLEPENPDAG